jgi:cobalamin biosynthesis protein CobT
MPEVEEFRTKIEAITERLGESNGADSDVVRGLKERLGMVRDSLQRKQENIDSQNAEIASLREENGQLSDMLGQAVTALETQDQGGIREIVQSIDNEFAGLLVDGEAQAEQGTDTDSGQQGAEFGEAESQETESQETESQETESRETESRETESQETESQETESQETESKETESQNSEWQPDDESPRTLKRIMERRKR